MQIKYLGKDKFEIKANQALISLNQKVAINGFELPGPGEYEKSSVSVMGIPNTHTTIYTIIAEDISLCYLGKLDQTLSVEEAKEIGNIDILFLPLGDEGTLPVKKGLEVVAKIDPRVVIPMLYTDLEEFKKSEGVTDGELDIYKVKKADLPDEERQIVILKSFER